METSTYSNTVIKHCLYFLMVFTSIPVSAQCDNTAITPSTPDHRFTIISYRASEFSAAVPQIVRDNLTGLEWTICSIGQTPAGTSAAPSCQGAPTPHTWGTALSMAGNHVVTIGSFEVPGVLNDWRLPNIKELSSIVEHCNNSPAISHGLFPDTPNEEYWSSSPSINIAGTDSMIVLFSSGGVSIANKTNGHAFRLVRGGK